MATPVQEQTPATPATAIPDDSFSHTLPDGRRIQADIREDLFDTFLDQLVDIRKQVHTLLHDIDVAFIPRIMSFKRLAGRRGEIVIVWSEEADDHVDVYFRAKEAQS